MPGKDIPKENETLIRPIPVNEESLPDTVRVIKTGLAYDPAVKASTRAPLEGWCRENDKIIHSKEHPGQSNPYSNRRKERGE